MKKFFLAENFFNFFVNLLKVLFILFFGLVVFSCNIDSEHGIYYKISTSMQPSGIKIIDYIGFYNDKHYILSENAVYSVSPSGSEKISETENKFFRESFLAGGTVWLLNSDGIVFKYNLNSKQFEKYSNEIFNGINNGILYKTGSNSKFINISSANEVSVNITNPLFSDKYLVCFSDSVAKIYDTTSNSSEPILKITNFSSTHLSGFQYIQSMESIIIFEKNNAYFISKNQIENETEISLNDLKKIATEMGTLPSSGHYYTSSEYAGGKILVNYSSGFYSLELSSDNNEINCKKENQSWMSSLNGVKVTKLFCFDNNKIAIATYENGFHIADMNSRNSAELEKELI